MNISRYSVFSFISTYSEPVPSTHTSVLGRIPPAKHAGLDGAVEGHQLLALGVHDLHCEGTHVAVPGGKALLYSYKYVKMLDKILLSLEKKYIFYHLHLPR